MDKREIQAYTPELSMIMPVYNEEEVISRVVCSWVAELDRIGINYELLVYDDGSQDSTGHVLGDLADRLQRLVLRRHENSGHGATILRGYWEAQGEWVFQVDSDDEMAPDHFKELWVERNRYDLLLGCRKNRHSSIPRRFISAVSRLTVWILFGRKFCDVNTPYRLIKRTCLTKILPRIPMDTFAPNVIMCGLAAQDRLRIFECWVPHQERKSGATSIVKWKMWKAAMRSFVQTLRVAFCDFKGNS